MGDRIIKMVVVVFGLFLLSRTPILAEGEMILYVQEGCGHCEKVEEFIEENDLGEEIVSKNTSIDPGASEEYTDFLDAQEVPLEERGVPVLVYDEDQYLIGDSLIISYLSEKYGIEEEERPSYDQSDYLLLFVGGGIVFAIVGYGIFNTIQSSKKS